MVELPWAVTNAGNPRKPEPTSLPGPTGLDNECSLPQPDTGQLDHDLPYECQQNLRRPRPLHFFLHRLLFVCSRLHDGQVLSTYLLMSSRVTRSSARQAASQAASSIPSTASALPVPPPPPIPPTPTPAPSARKRKTNTSPAQGGTESPSSVRKTKRQRVAEASPPPQQPPVPAPTPSSVTRHRKGKAPAAMSSPGCVGRKIKPNKTSGPKC